MAGFNVNKFVAGSEECKADSFELQKVDATVEIASPKRTRKKKEDEIIVVGNDGSGLSLIQSNQSYMTAYEETNSQLNDAIMQLDALGNAVVSELNEIKGSRTIKNKYGYINDMTSTASSIISAKISAIKEKNKTINDVNNMELKRMKDLNLNESKEDDNTRIMNLYDAFVNTPVGSGMAPSSVLGPSFSDMTIYNSGNAGQQAMMLQGGDNSMDIAWQQGLDPAKNRMLLQAQGRIKTVVYFNNETGDRWFDVIDPTTGVPVPNVEKPDPGRLYELELNLAGGFAKDKQLNETYDLIVLGNTSLYGY